MIWQISYDLHGFIHPRWLALGFLPSTSPLVRLDSPALDTGGKRYQRGKVRFVFPLDIIILTFNIDTQKNLSIFDWLVLNPPPCCSFARHLVGENGHPLLICSSLSTCQLKPEIYLFQSTPLFLGYPLGLPPTQ